MTYQEHVELLRESETYKHHYWLFDMLDGYEGIDGVSLDEMYRKGYMLEISKTPCDTSCDYTDTLAEAMYKVVLTHPTNESELVGYDFYAVSKTRDLSLLKSDLAFVRDRKESHEAEGHTDAVKMYDNIARMLQNKIRRYRRAC